MLGRNELAGLELIKSVGDPEMDAQFGDKKWFDIE